LNRVERTTSDDYRRRVLTIGERQLSRVGDFELNTMMQRLGQVLYYMDVVYRVFARYSQLNADFLAAMQRLQSSTTATGGGVMSPEQIRLHDEQHALGDELRQEIETFYLFSRILLDRMTQAFTATLGEGQHAQTSFHKLIGSIDKYVAGRELPPVPEVHKELMRQLEADIVDFRDNQIVHEKSPRGMWPIGFDSVRHETYLMYTRLYPRESDKEVHGKYPSDLLKTIEEYSGEWLSYLEDNTR
jgi:hypothetical protein